MQPPRSRPCRARVAPRAETPGVFRVDLPSIAGPGTGQEIGGIARTCVGTMLFHEPQPDPSAPRHDPCVGPWSLILMFTCEVRQGAELDRPVLVNVMTSVEELEPA